MLRWRFILSLVLFLFTNATVAAQGTIDLTFKVLVNAPVDATISDVCCAQSERWSNLSPVTSYQTQYGGTPIWIKVEGITDGGLIQFLPILDRVTLYTRETPNSDWDSSVTGDMVRNDIKVFETPFMALPLPANLDINNVYARVDMSVAVSVIARQWNLPAFIEMQNIDRTQKTFLLGFIVAIALYNIVVSGLVRDAVFLANALCIMSLLMVALYLSGYGAAYLWVGMPHISNSVLVVSVASAVIFGGLFTYLFLRTPDQSPPRNHALFAAPAMIVLGLVMITIFGAPFWVAQATALACAVIFCVVLLVVLAIGGWRGDKKARLLTIPFAVAVLPGIVLVIMQKIVGANPFGLGNNTMEITLALEAMVFSLALASRIRVTENANRQAATELLAERNRSTSLALAAQDNERKRLAKELHDGVGQEMLLVVSKLKRMAKQGEAAMVGGSVQDLVRSSSAIMNSLRRISRDMHPASTEHLGLAGTIEEMAHQLNAASQIEFTHELQVDGRAFKPEAQLHVVRIVQEVLANVVKHSGATRCNITVRVEADDLKINVDDDGIGLDQDEHADQSRFGLGLTSIDERVRSLGANWKMQSSPLGGLATTVEVPLVSLAMAAD